ncbi:MAG: hypothetical protein AB1374_05905 [Bacillota bacterium]
MQKFINPLKILSRIAVNHPSVGEFAVDYEQRRVFLPPGLFDQAAEVLGVCPAAGAAAFEIGGWEWRKW